MLMSHTHIKKYDRKFFFPCVNDKTKDFYTITVIITPLVGKGIQIKTIWLSKISFPPAKSLPYLRFAKGCSHFQSSLEPVAGIP